MFSKPRTTATSGHMFSNIFIMHFCVTESDVLEESALLPKSLSVGTKQTDESPKADLEDMGEHDADSCSGEEKDKVTSCEDMPTSCPGMSCGQRDTENNESQNVCFPVSLLTDYVHTTS